MYKNNKFLLIAFVSLVIAFGVFDFFYKNKKDEFFKNDSTTQSAIAMAQSYQKGITIEWILEPGAKIISKSKDSLKDRIQYTLVYESKLTQQEALDGYDKFLRGRGWNTKIVKDEKDNSLNIYATKDKDEAFVTVSINKTSKKVNVDIIVLQDSVLVSQNSPN